MIWPCIAFLLIVLANSTVLGIALTAVAILLLYKNYLLIRSLKKKGKSLFVLLSGLTPFEKTVVMTYDVGVAALILSLALRNVMSEWADLMILAIAVSVSIVLRNAFALNKDVSFQSWLLTSSIDAIEAVKDAERDIADIKEALETGVNDPRMAVWLWDKTGSLKIKAGGLVKTSPGMPAIGDNVFEVFDDWGGTAAISMHGLRAGEEEVWYTTETPSKKLLSGSQRKLYSVRLVQREGDVGGGLAIIFDITGEPSAVSAIQEKAKEEIEAARKKALSSLEIQNAMSRAYTSLSSMRELDSKDDTK